jgi:hypothetical protein
MALVIPRSVMPIDAYRSSRTRRRRNDGITNIAARLPSLHLPAAAELGERITARA